MNTTNNDISPGAGQTPRIRGRTAANPAAPVPAPGFESSPGQPEQDEYYQPPLLQPTQDRPNKNRPLVVLWDQTHEDDNRIAWPPDELFKLSCHPNVVLFHLDWAGHCSFELHGLWKKFRGIGWFMVPAGCQGTSYYGLGSPPIFTKTLHFLGLYQRGKVPAPAIVPGQIVDGGFPGVIRLVEAMWPRPVTDLVAGGSASGLETVHAHPAAAAK